MFIDVTTDGVSDGEERLPIKNTVGCSLHLVDFCVKNALKTVLRVFLISKIFLFHKGREGFSEKYAT